MTSAPNNFHSKMIYNGGNSSYPDGSTSIAAPQWVIVLTSVMLFILAASNGVPFWTSSGPWSLMLSLILILGRGPRQIFKACLSGPALPLTLTMFLFILANLVSAIANFSPEALAEAVFRSLVPFVVYLALSGLTLQPKQVTALGLAVAGGAGLLFLRGFFAYIAVVDFPDMHTLMWARYDPAVIEVYGMATLGNVGRIGAYIVLVLPMLMLLTLLNRRRAGFFPLLLIIALGVANLIFAGSRASIVLCIAELLALLSIAGAKKILMTGMALLLLLYFTIRYWVALIFDPEFIERYLPVLGQYSEDRSANERFWSIEEGLESFYNNVTFGIGPGNSATQNTYTVPHASIVHQLSELGLIGGMIFTALCAIIIVQGTISFLRFNQRPNELYRFMWLSGPTFWILFGIFAGISFTASVALVWIGICYAMLGLSTAQIVSHDHD